MTTMKQSRLSRGMTQLAVVARAKIGLSTYRRAEATGVVSHSIALRVARVLGAKKEEWSTWGVQGANRSNYGRPAKEEEVTP